MESENWIPTVKKKDRFWDLYSGMLADGVIFVNAPLNQRMAGLVISSIIHLCADASDKVEAKIYLNTKHGDLLASLAVVDVLEFFKLQGTRIHTMSLGEVGVAAGLVLAAGTRGLRKAARHCRVSLRCGLQSFDFETGLSEQARSLEIERVTAIFVSSLATYCERERDEFRARVVLEDYLEASKAKELGLFDEIL